MPEAISSALISEVGPRDGLQSISQIMATQDKEEWIAALYAAGLREIEVGSFVPATIMPQLGDTGQIVKYARAFPGLVVAALAPNLYGARKAFEAGAHKVTIPVSVTEAHSLANVRKTHEQVFADLSEIVALKRAQFPAAHLEVGLSVAFGCTLRGAVSDQETLGMAVKVAELGVDEVGLSDTTGYATPRQVARLFKALHAELGERAGAAHFHNTRGQGLANVLAALDVGVTTFDASQGGLGGCPYAPGASGNIVTEDLVFLLESMGVDTGVDIEKLIHARDLLKEALPGEALHGMVPEAGLPKGFTYAAQR